MTTAVVASPPLAGSLADPLASSSRTGPLVIGSRTGDLIFTPRRETVVPKSLPGPLVISSRNGNLVFTPKPGPPAFGSAVSRSGAQAPGFGSQTVAQASARTAYEKACALLIAQGKCNGTIGLAAGQHSAEGVLDVVRAASVKYEARKTSKACQLLAGFSQRITYYGRVMDVLVQHHPEYVSLAWGTMKILFILFQNHEEILIGLTLSLTDITTKLEHVKIHGELFQDSKMQEAITDLYVLLIGHFQAMLNFYQNGSLMRAWNSFWNPWKISFQDRIDRVESSVESINALAAALHHQEQRHGNQTLQEIHTKQDLAIVTQSQTAVRLNTGIEAVAQSVDHLRLEMGQMKRLQGDLLQAIQLVGIELRPVSSTSQSLEPSSSKQAHLLVSGFAHLLNDFERRLWELEQFIPGTRKTLRLKYNMFYKEDWRRSVEYATQLLEMTAFLEKLASLDSDLHCLICPAVGIDAKLIFPCTQHFSDLAHTFRSFTGYQWPKSIDHARVPKLRTRNAILLDATKLLLGLYRPAAKSDAASGAKSGVYVLDNESKETLNSLFERLERVNDELCQDTGTSQEAPRVQEV